MYDPQRDPTGRIADMQDLHEMKRIARSPADVAEINESLNVIQNESRSTRQTRALLVKARREGNMDEVHNITEYLAKKEGIKAPKFDGKPQ